MQLLSEILPDILAGFPEISLVYLFGSQVTGQVGPMSDYDLGILTDVPDNEPVTQARFQHALVAALQTGRGEVRQIDVVLLKQAPIELAYHIIAQGKLLYQRDLAEKVEYEARVLGLYGDYLPVLRSFRDQILQGESNDRRVQRYREAFRRTERTLGQARTTEGKEPRRI